MIGYIYTSRNVVFNEASAWWPSKYLVQQDIRGLGAKNEERIHDQVDSEDVAPTNKEDKSLRSSKVKRQWKIGVHEEVDKEFPQLQEEIPPSLRRSLRVRNPN